MRGKRMRIEAILILFAASFAVLTIAFVGRYMTDDLLKCLAFLILAAWLLARAA